MEFETVNPESANFVVPQLKKQVSGVSVNAINNDAPSKPLKIPAEK
jgi:hypothetical protein